MEKNKYISNLPEQVLDEIALYVKAAVEIYGIISISKLVEIINSQNEYKVTEDDIKFVFNRGDHFYCCIYKKNIVHESLLLFNDDDDYNDMSSKQKDNPYKVPDKVEFLQKSDSHSIQMPEIFQKLRKYLVADVEIMRNVAEEICDDIFIGCKFNRNEKNIIYEFTRRGIYPTDEQIKRIYIIYIECREKTPLWENRGYTNEELNQMGININYDE